MSGLPPLPDGFQIVAPALPALPEGFTVVGQEPPPPPVAGPEMPVYDAMGNPTGMSAPTGGPPPIVPSTGRDVLMSAGAAVRDGISGLVGVPALIKQGAGMAADAGYSLVTGQEPPPNVSTIPQPPSASAVKGALESVTGGPYESQTTLGKYVRAGTEFAVGGAAVPARGIAQVLGNAVKYGAVPGIASEAAGQATQGTPIEPAARIVAALTTAGGLGAVEASRARAAQLAKVPSADDLHALAQSNYGVARAAGVRISPQSYEQAIDDVVTTVKNSGYDPAVQTGTAAALKALENRRGTAPTLEEADLMRQLLRDAGKTGQDARTAGIAREKFDEFLDGLSPAQITAGDARQGVEALHEARSLWSRSKKADQVADALERAERGASKTGTGGNVDNQTRQKVDTLLGKAEKRGGWTDEEIDAAKRVVNGTPVGNAARLVGRLSPEGNGLMLMLHALGAGVAPGFSLPLAATGFVAKRVGNASTRQNAALLDALIRSGGQLPAAPRNDALVRALAAGNAAAQSPRR